MVPVAMSTIPQLGGQSSELSESWSSVAYKLEDNTRSRGTSESTQESLEFSSTSTQASLTDSCTVESIASSNEGSGSPKVFSRQSTQESNEIPAGIDHSDFALESPRKSSEASGDGDTHDVISDSDAAYSLHDLLLVRACVQGKGCDLGIHCKAAPPGITGSTSERYPARRQVDSIMKRARSFSRARDNSKRPTPRGTGARANLVKRATSVPPSRDSSSLVDRVLDALADPDPFADLLGGIGGGIPPGIFVSKDQDAADVWTQCMPSLNYFGPHMVALAAETCDEQHMVALAAAEQSARHLKHVNGQAAEAFHASDLALQGKRRCRSRSPCIQLNSDEYFVRSRKMREQVEYYFSAENLSQDSFLWSLMDSDGWVVLSSIIAFPKMQSLGATCDSIIQCLASSEIVELSWDGCAVRSQVQSWPCAFDSIQMQEPTKLSADAPTWIPSSTITFPADTQAGKRKCKSRRRGTKLKIATNLHYIESKDAECIFLAYRIHRLGFESASILHEHYEQYGVVSEVLLSNGHEKDPDEHSFTRVRPSGIAIVVMQDPKGAAAAVAAGENQEVSGVDIRVRKFHRRGSEPVTTASMVEGTNLQPQAVEAEKEFERFVN